MNIGWNWSDRSIRLILAIVPMLTAICLQYIDVKIHKKSVPIIVILFLVLSTIELYRCQPLIPPASSIPKFDLPADEPTVYVNYVNTIYQRDMIAFAEKYVPYDARICCDITTQRQFYGLTSTTFFQSHIIYYYPLETEERFPFDLFLIHLPGKAGAINNRAETRTKNLILSSIYASNIVYSNSESYMLIER